MTTTPGNAVPKIASPKIASHRGGARLWPENSRLAFHRSMELSVDFIEFDIHRSLDGVLFVHHDAVLGRTAEGEGPVDALDWARLGRIRLKGTDETMPDLDTVLDILS